jgi:hypothetical protein
MIIDRLKRMRKIPSNWQVKSLGEVTEAMAGHVMIR